MNDEVGVFPKSLDVGGRQAARRDVDGLVLDVDLEVVGVGVVLDADQFRLGLAEQPVVFGVGAQADELVLGVGGHREGTRERLGGGDRIVAQHLVGREHLFVDDRSGVGGEHLGEGLVVGQLQLEVDRQRIRRFDAVEVGQQRLRSIGIVDRVLPVDGELDIRGRQRMPVGELEVRLQLAGERRRRGEVAALRDVRFQIAAARDEVHQERVHLVHHLQRPVVVRARRIERGDLVGGSDGQVLTTDRIGRATESASGDDEREGG